MTDFLKEASALCIGLVACSLGVGGAGLAATTAAGELAVTAIGCLRAMGADRRRVAAAQATVRTDWAARAREDPDIARMEDFLALNAGGVPIEREIFRGLLKSGKYETAATDHLLARLGIADIGLSEQAQAYARALLQSGVASAMEGKAFRDQLASEGMLAVLELVAQPQNGIPRSLLESLAQRFGHDNPDAPVAELERHLKDKAVEWKALKARLAELEASDARIADIRAAAEDALAAGDFDTAHARLDDALRLRTEDEALPALRKLAEIHALKAETHLLQGDAAKAAAAFETGARLFSGVDRWEEARTREAFAISLYNHGLRFGGAGLSLASTACRKNLEIASRAEHPGLWATTLSNLALALREQAARTEGEESTHLLAEAVTAYRSALEVYNHARHPEAWSKTQNNLAMALRSQAARTEGQAGVLLLAEAAAAYRAILKIPLHVNHSVFWATTQNNLANVLRDQAARTEGEAAANLLAEAAMAYQVALEVATRIEHPRYWAITQNNLGNVRADQAAHTEGLPGIKLFVKAITSYRAALEVRTRADHPVDWAMTQNNLAAALAKQAARTEGAAGTDLFAEAVTTYHAALEVYTRRDHPVDWAMTQNNLAAALAHQAARTEGAAGTDLLAEAVTAYRAALEVYTRAAHPVNWAMTQENLGLAFEAMAERAAGDPGALYAEALACVDRALEVFDPAHMAPDHATCRRNRDRVAAKLAALGPSEGPQGPKTE
ncbi:tetratricopeptide repeat protein [Rhodobacteraceae bacterium DSL-40]|uniref:tetratricopeptide repeat protein n=1 Tax=Amaricoccus sp. B4 TaxID=3368557 RepID=UPI000DAD5C09